VCISVALGVSGVLVSAALLFVASTPSVQAQYAATTTVSLTVCGDGLVAPIEVCDDGVNSGAYSTSIGGRNCNPLCNGYGPYCGDAIIETLYGEECDDGNNSDGDLCDALCQNESDPVTVGGGGSGGSGGGGGKGSGNNKIPGASDDGEIDYYGDTDVVIQGRACPGATITILRDGEIERVVEADGDASFDYTLTDQVPGITTFGFWALDTQDRRSITYSATFQIVENAATTLSGILIPPTLIVDPEKVPPGSPVSFAGCAVPDATVQAYVNEDETPIETLSAGNGEWAIGYDTSQLGVEVFHTVKASYLDPTNAALESGYSAITSFYVGNNDVDTNLTADLNFDGSVNLTDFSILLFNWNGTGGIADINQDGLVSLADFSIMLFYWTG